MTSPDKVYFPDVGLTKINIVEYVLAVGDGLFAALQDRPVTMERWPGGYRPDVKLSTRGDTHGEAFYQKRAPSKGMPDWVETVTIAFPSGRTADEVCPTELAVWPGWPTWVPSATIRGRSSLRHRQPTSCGSILIRSQEPTSLTPYGLRTSLRGAGDAGLVGDPRPAAAADVVFVPIEPSYGFVEAPTR